MDNNKLCLLKGINKNFFKNLNCSTNIDNNDTEFFNFFSSFLFILFISIIPMFFIYKFWKIKSKKVKKIETPISSDSSSFEMDSISEMEDTSHIFIKNDDVSKEKMLDIVYNVICKDTILSVSNINKLVKNIKNNKSMQDAYKKAKKLYNTFNHQTKNLPIYKQIISKLQQLPINQSKYDNIIILFLTISYAKL